MRSEKPERRISLQTEVGTPRPATFNSTSEEESSPPLHLRTSESSGMFPAIVTGPNREVCRRSSTASAHRTLRKARTKPSCARISSSASPYSTALSRLFKGNPNAVGVCRQRGCRLTSENMPFLAPCVNIFGAHLATFMTFCDKISSRLDGNQTYRTRLINSSGSSQVFLSKRGHWGFSAPCAAMLGSVSHLCRHRKSLPRSWFSSEHIFRLLARNSLNESENTFSNRLGVWANRYIRDVLRGGGGKGVSPGPITGVSKKVINWF